MQADSRNFVLFVFFVAKNNFVAKIEKKRVAAAPKDVFLRFPGTAAARMDVVCRAAALQLHASGNFGFLTRRGD